MSQREALRGLLEKYRLLLALHQAKPERSPARRQSMAAVARRFPGALREWQALSPAALQDRHDRLQSWLAADALPTALPAWVHYSLDLHAWLRLILALRTCSPHEADGPRADRLQMAQQICVEIGEPTLVARITPSLIEQIDRPVGIGGQLSRGAYAAVAAQHGVSIEDVKAVLFGATAESIDVA